MGRGRSRYYSLGGKRRERPEDIPREADRNSAVDFERQEVPPVQGDQDCGGSRDSAGEDMVVRRMFSYDPRDQATRAHDHSDALEEICKALHSLRCYIQPAEVSAHFIKDRR